MVTWREFRYGMRASDAGAVLGVPTAEDNRLLNLLSESGSACNMLDIPAALASCREETMLCSECLEASDRVDFFCCLDCIRVVEEEEFEHFGRLTSECHVSSSSPLFG